MIINWTIRVLSYDAPHELNNWPRTHIAQILLGAASFLFTFLEVDTILLGGIPLSWAIRSLCTPWHGWQLNMSCFPINYLTCLHTATFMLFSIFSLVAVISLKILGKPLSWHEKCSLLVSVHGSKLPLP